MLFSNDIQVQVSSAKRKIKKRNKWSNNNLNKKWKRRNNGQYFKNIKKTLREYYEQLYAMKLAVLEDTNKFLETYIPSKWIKKIQTYE